MKLTQFRIQKYKCILDSGWVKVSSLAVLIGKNESGKTSLLKALHKFNPFKPEPYSIAGEWPRGYRGERSEGQVVCAAEFLLDTEEIRGLQQLAPQGVVSDHVQVTKDYAGRFEVLFPQELFPEELSRKLQSTDSMQRKARDFIIQRLPTFVYMDEYQAFCGTAELDKIKRRKDAGDLQPADETFLTILALAELDFEQEYKKGGATSDEAREERQYDLSDAEATLNRKIEGHWGQLRYQAQFRANGYQFMTFVKGLNDTALIRLEDRSKGFQWFFSFDLMLMHDMRGKLENCVILLDEPGLHLHPEGQRDLLKRLSEYAAGNTLIYTTHLPFMIDLQEPDRIRLLSETEKGTIVSEDLATSQPAARLVVQAALGISGQTNGLIAEQNLILEGSNDYWIISELSNLFRRTGKDGLPQDVLVTPASGATEVTYLAALMVGQGLDVVAVFDNDLPGQAARDKLVKKWLPKYRDQKATVLDLAAAVGRAGQEFAIEELFPETFYVDRINKTYQKEISACGISLSPLPTGTTLARRVEAAFSTTHVQFNRRRVCRRIAADIRQMKTPTELPEQTRRMAEQLFAAIAKAFGRA